MNTEEYLSQLLSGELCQCSPGNCIEWHSNCIVNDIIEEIENFCNIMGWTKKDFLLEIKYYDYEKNKLLCRVDN